MQKSWIYDLFRRTQNVAHRSYATCKSFCCGPEIIFFFFFILSYHVCAGAECWGVIRYRIHLFISPPPKFHQLDIAISSETRYVFCPPPKSITRYPARFKFCYIPNLKYIIPDDVLAKYGYHFTLEKWLVGLFYGISTIVGFLISNLFHTYIKNIWFLNTFCRNHFKQARAHLLKQLNYFTYFCLIWIILSIINHLFAQFNVFK